MSNKICRLCGQVFMIGEQEDEIGFDDCFDIDDSDICPSCTRELREE